MQPRICVTPRFRRIYHALDTDRQRMAEAEVHQFIRRYESSASSVANKYDRIEHLKGCRDAARSLIQVLEMKSGSGDRMLAAWKPPSLTLLAMGKHIATDALTRSEVTNLLIEAEEAPSQFLCNQRQGFFKPNPSNQWATYGSELEPHWVYELDNQQTDILEAIYDSSLEILLSEGFYQVHVIIGGPGTGKTCILLNLLKRYHDDGVNVRLVLSTEVHSYLSAATSIDLDRFRGETKPTDQPDCDVLLIDDPESVQKLERAIGFGKYGSVKIVVLAFDPLQLNKALSDDEYKRLNEAHSIFEHRLSVCYRQKEYVGLIVKQAIDTIAQSTSYLDQQKKEEQWRKHRMLTELSNTLTFVNPFGYTQLYEQAQLSDIQVELTRIRRQPGGMWKHWYSLMVAMIDNDLQSFPKQWLKALDNSGVNFRIVRHEQLWNIKGVEFQHVFLWMGPQLYQRITNGFEGSGTPKYEQTRLLRIPYSRAKDSLVLFVAAA